MTRATLDQAGVRGSDRVLVALNNDGELGGAFIARAAAGIAQAAASVGPRGRMRLMQALRTLRADVLVTTPTGLADLLARLHLEFLADPLDLELRLILVTGEITDHRTLRHLANEFDAEVVELYTDPVTGVPVATRATKSADDPLRATRDGLLSLAELDADQPVGAAPACPFAELVVTHSWHGLLNGFAVRTGHVVPSPASEGVGLPAPRHTVGDFVLVRGRWLPIGRFEQNLRLIDGISRWRLEVARKGTLDTATLHIAFARDSLVGNRMWHGRIAQAVSALTPVDVTVRVQDGVAEEPRPPVIDDQRGHHLARDRKAVGR
ncbi:MAG: hypothetical protein HOV68_12320 [Streptomycetaceae bacterium]|nr:hypothetical protein [Streptomycetaceae bacterium]